MAGRTVIDGGRAETEARVQSQEVYCHEEDNWDEPELARDYEEAERKFLEGTWNGVAVTQQAELLIAGNHFTVRIDTGAIYMGVFELDASALPKRIDMRINEGPAPHKGKTALCIYELDEDVFRMCAARPGDTQRLTAFPTESAGNYFCMTFRREKPFGS